MKNLFCYLLLFFLLFNDNQYSQEKRNFKIHTIAFYNLENLFDTINDVNKNDEASPIMEMKFNRSNVYKKKISNMAKVISQIGYDYTKKSPSIVGICEVENLNVVQDLISQEELENENYGIVHYDSPDNRGIDVGLIYKKNIFEVKSSSSHEVIITDNNSSNRRTTRDLSLIHI